MLEVSGAWVWGELAGSADPPPPTTTKYVKVSVQNCNILLEICAQGVWKEKCFAWR
jgi:hypothetical protein